MSKYIILIIMFAAAWAVTLVTGAPMWPMSLMSIAALLGITGLFFWRRWSARRAAREIERMLRGQASDQAASAKPEQQDELGELRKEFERAVASLRDSKLKRRGYDALYALPWFVIIGPPGAGKTTALRNSGLTFPYMSAGRGGIRGVGGTRNCDWWLSNEAILLDTAGRYTTEPEDQEEWFAFLDMLRKHRPRKPINGALVAIPIDELGGMSADELKEASEMVRQRLDELNERLDMRLPVYVLFTKVDLVPGFVELFGALKRSERAQVWGMTAPVDEKPEDLEYYFERQLDQLLARLEPFTTRRLAATRRIEDRERILCFPQQLAALVPALTSFMTVVFSDNVYRDTPRLRGFYFTSGVQEGSPIDRVMSSMTSAFGLPRAVEPAERAADSKSYFLGDLFRDVVFRDDALAVRSDAERRRARRSKLLTASGILACAGLVLVLPGYAYWQNTETIERARLAAYAVAKERGEHPDARPIAPPALARLERVLSELLDHTFWTRVRAGFGLYVGEQLREELSALYGTLVAEEVLDPLLSSDVDAMLRLVQDYQERGQSAPDESLSYGLFHQYHDMLRLHLMLSQLEGDATPAEREDAGEPAETDEAEPGAQRLRQPPLSDAPEQRWLRERVTDYWITSEGIVDNEVNAARGRAIIGTFLRLAAARPEFAARYLTEREQTMVTEVRGVLRREVLSRRQVEGLEEYCRRADYDLTLRDIMGSVTNVTATGRVSGVYTRRGWEDCVRESIMSREPYGWIGDDIKLWVLGVSSEEEAIELDVTAIRHAYLNNFADEWRAFLRSIEVTHPQNHEQALLMLHDLTGGGVLTPYARLFRVVDYNSRLEYLPKAGGTPDDDTPKATPGAKEESPSRLSRLGGLFRGGRRIQRATTALQKPSEDAGAGAGAEDKQDAAARAVVLRLTPQHIRERFIGFARFGAPPQWQKTGDPGGEPSGDAPPPPPVDLDIYTEQLAFARDAIQTYVDDPESGDRLVRRLEGVRTRVRGLIESQEAPWRPRFEALLWPPVEGLTGSTNESIAEGLSRRWCSDVVVYWDRELAGRYPFRARSLEDVKVDDFNHFFHPKEGTLWRFYQEVLGTQILREGDHFVFAKRMGRDYSDVFEPGVLEFLTAALDLTNAMFPPGADAALVDLDATLMPSPGIEQIVLTLGEQVLVHQNGPERTRPLKWSSEEEELRAGVDVTGMTFQQDLEQGGSWGLFRLLERGDVDGPGRGGRFTTTWTFHDQDKSSVKVVFRPKRVESPFYGVPERGHGKFLAPFRARALSIPRRLARRAPLCPRHRRVDEQGARKQPRGKRGRTRKPQGERPQGSS